MFASIVKEAQLKGNKSLILTHRKELLFQSGGTFDMVGVNAHLLTAKTKDVPQGEVVVAMLETLYRRVQNKEEYEHFISQFDIIIIDESHYGGHDKIFRYIPDNAIVLGWSATPYRKGSSNSLSDFYQEMVQKVDVPDLIIDGYLSKPNTYGVRVDLSRVRIENTDYNPNDMHQEYQRQRVYDGVISNYKKICPGKKTILFAASVESSRDMMIRFNNAGITAAHIDANTPDDERAETIQMFRSGKYRVLCNMGVLTMGFDVKDIEVVIMYRATKSLPLFLQCVGRASRVTDDKKEFTLLDFGNNVDQHNFWETPRQWSLKNDTSRFRRESVNHKECPECGRMVSLNRTTCECGYIWEQTRIEQVEEVIIADLEKMDGFNVQMYALGKTFEELEMIAKYKNYKAAWILHNLTSLEDLRAYGRYKNYAAGWYHFAKRTFKPKTREQRESEIELFKQRMRDEAQR